MQSVPGVTFAEGGLDLFRRSTWFASSRRRRDRPGRRALRRRPGGHGRSPTATCSGARIPNSFRGHIKAAGWEHVRTLGLIEEAERIGSEAVELLSAPECPSEITTLILDSGQVELQVHESIGHPIELDRVLGMEEAYAGSSFLTRGGPRDAQVRQPARLDHGRRHAARRARLVRLRRRGRSRAARPHHRGRHLPELPDEPRDGAGRRPGSNGDQPRRRMVAPPADPHDEHLARAARGLARRDHRRHEGRHLHGHEPVVVDRRQARSTSSSAARSRGGSRTAS